MKEEFLHILKQGLQALSIRASEDLTEKYLLYYRELRRWNRAYNITGLKSEREIAINLFLDSLLYLKVLPPGNIKALDVGTGGGFPGLVLKIIRPEINMTLLEPSRKRTAFLNHLIRRLNIEGVTVVQKTLEEYTRLVRDVCFDLIFTKVFFKTPDFLTKTADLVSEGSLLVLSKGPAYKAELVETTRKLGPKIKDYSIETVSLKIPLTDIIRNLIIVRVLRE